MAKKSSIEKNLNRRTEVAKFRARRTALKAVIYDREKPMEERFEAVLRLAKMPRRSSLTRIRNRCELTGRARGYHRKFKLSRIMLRELISEGKIPGAVKASW